MSRGLQEMLSIILTAIEGHTLDMSTSLGLPRTGEVLQMNPSARLSH